MNRNLLLVLLFLSPTAVIAQQEQQNNTNSFIKGLGIQFEQDFFLEYLQLPSLNEDRNYTQGAGISLFTRPFCTNYILVSDREKYRLIYPNKINFQFGAFTPDDLRNKEPVIGDRPYATIMFIGFESTIMNPEKKILVNQGLSIGLMGVDGPAEAIQTWVHEGMNDNNTNPPYNPEGWHNQISNGGEPTIQYSRSVVKLLTTEGLDSEVNNEGEKNANFKKYLVTANFTLDAGYLTQVSGGLTFKVGKLDYANWGSNLFSQLNGISPMVGSEDDGKYHEYYQKDKDSEFYLFASVQPAITLYNGSLHGGFKETAYRLPYWDTNFLNGQGRLGMGWTSSVHSFAIYYAAKTPELIGEYSRYHLWGGVSLAFHP